MNYQLQDHTIILESYKNYNLTLKVKDLPELEKPREKMIAGGPTILSSAELLAIILGTGTKKEEVLTMASRLLKEYGEKAIVSQTDPRIIERELNLPITKACQVVACFELGRRFFKKQTGSLINIRNAKQAFDYLTDMRSLNKEQFRGLYLNSRYQLIHDEVISIGSLTASVIHPREVFKPALEYSAAAIIVAHNHPSGVLKATEADLEVTRHLAEAGKILGIDFLDHLIIGNNKFISII